MDAGDAVHNRIVISGGGDIVLGAKRVKLEDAVDAVCSGIVVYGAKRSNQWMQSYSVLCPLCDCIN